MKYYISQEFHGKEDAHTPTGCIKGSRQQTRENRGGNTGGMKYYISQEFHGKDAHPPTGCIKGSRQQTRENRGCNTGGMKYYIVRNFTVKKIPTPLQDVSKAVASKPERTEAAIQEV